MKNIILLILALLLNIAIAKGFYEIGLSKGIAQTRQQIETMEARCIDWSSYDL